VSNAVNNYRNVKTSGPYGHGDAITIIANRSISANGEHSSYDSTQMSVTITGGTFSSAKNYAVRYVDCDYGDNADATYNYEPLVSITGGTFNSAVDFSTANAADTKAAKPITGGTFSSDVKDYVAEGYSSVNVGTDKWTVQSATYEATIDGKPYETLAAAVEAAKNGDTITLLKDVTNPGKMEISGKTITIDMNEKEITMKTDETDRFYISGGGLKLTGTGTIIGGKGPLSLVGLA
jgi:hypothetical protein